MANSLELQVGNLLHERGLKLVLAESCTGGLLGSRITDVPGSSEYFLGGVMAYAYEAKVALLGVSWETLNTKGAVSRETVLEMARGVRELLQGDVAVAVSGIAGPGGGTPEKPVGLTFIGLVRRDQAPQVKQHIWRGDREAIKTASADAALEWILRVAEAQA